MLIKDMNVDVEGDSLDEQSTAVAACLISAEFWCVIPARRVIQMMGEAFFDRLVVLAIRMNIV